MICCFQYFIYRVHTHHHILQVLFVMNIFVCLSVYLSVSLPVCFSTMNSPKPICAIVIMLSSVINIAGSTIHGLLLTNVQFVQCSEMLLAQIIISKGNIILCILLVMIAIRARRSCGLYVEFQWLIFGLPVANMWTASV